MRSDADSLKVSDRANVISAVFAAYYNTWSQSEMQHETTEVERLNHNFVI
jgi:hypothetical protein